MRMVIDFIVFMVVLGVYADVVLLDSSTRDFVNRDSDVYHLSTEDRLSYSEIFLVIYVTVSAVKRLLYVVRV